MTPRLSCLLAALSLLGSARLPALDPTTPARTVAAKANSNVRAKPSLSSEILISVRKGQPLTVLGEVDDPKAAADEPKRWAEVALPTGTSVWIHGALVNSADHTVRGNTVNLRAGPGRNYSEVGSLARGTAIRELRESDGWLEIEAPEGSARGFVAVTLLGDKIHVIPPPVPVPATEATPTPRPRDQPRRVASRPVPLPPESSRPPPTTSRTAPPEVRVRSQPLQSDARAAVPPTVTVEQIPTEQNPTINPPPDAVPQTAPARVSNPLPTIPVPPPVLTTASQPETVPTHKVRQVVREGVVAFASSPQAPADYQLNSFRQDEGMIAFLYAEDARLELRDWRGKRVVVTGEEYMDPRWRRRPLLKVTAIHDAY